MKSIWVLILVAVYSSVTFLQAQNAVQDTLPLIPYPQQITLQQTFYRPESGTIIQVCSPDQEDYFAAKQLTEDLINLHKLDLKIEKSKTGFKKSIILTRPGVSKQADSRLKTAGLELQSDFNPEGYVLLVDGHGIVVSANSASGLFYGVQTLRQLLLSDETGCKVPFVSIRDWPAMRYRWQQADWNRGPIPTIEYAKKQVKILAEYKMNGYSIYSENLYQSKKHPAINEYGGTIGADEMAQLIAFAKQYHVEIIPQQQTFGHLHYVLRQERYSGLGEKHGSQILSPMEPGSYGFIGDYLGEIVPMFESQFFHIGCDETFELGRGKSKELIDRTSFADVYLGHLNKVAGMPALKDKKLLFWGELAVKNPEKLDLLPANVIAVAWDYLPRDSYEIFLKPYADKNISTFVAPAAFYGGRVFPDYASHMKNMRNFVRDGQQFHSLGMLNTSWNDLGEDLFDMGWYGVLYSAACSWQTGESSEKQYRRAFDWAFYRNASGHQFADGINELASVYEKAGAVNCEMATSCPFSREGASQQNRLIRMGISKDMRLLSEDAYTLFSQHQSNAFLHRETIDALLFAARRMDFVFHKALLAREMSKLYDAITRDDDKGFEVNTALYDLIVPYASRLGSLRDMTNELRNYHEILWNRENRPFHWGIIEARYLKMQMEWEDEYERIKCDLNQFATSGKHIPREEAGFIFEDL